MLPYAYQKSQGVKQKKGEPLGSPHLDSCRCQSITVCVLLAHFTLSEVGVAPVHAQNPIPVQLFPCVPRLQKFHLVWLKPWVVTVDDSGQEVSRNLIFDCFHVSSFLTTIYYLLGSCFVKCFSARAENFKGFSTLEISAVGHNPVHGFPCPFVGEGAVQRPYGGKIQVPPHNLSWFSVECAGHVTVTFCDFASECVAHASILPFLYRLCQVFCEKSLGVFQPPTVGLLAQL